MYLIIGISDWRRRRRRRWSGTYRSLACALRIRDIVRARCEAMGLPPPKQELISEILDSRTKELVSTKIDYHQPRNHCVILLWLLLCARPPCTIGAVLCQRKLTITNLSTTPRPVFPPGTVVDIACIARAPGLCIS
eukprot:SAG25_NODE_19_length_23408_cov_10.997040_6_plen_136_part_00